MATSGVTGTLSFNVNKIIDMAYRRCRISTNLITSEMLEKAKESLYLVLSDLANDNSPSWCITNTSLTMTASQAYVACPSGTVSVRHVLLNDNGYEIKLGRLSLDQYALLPNKAASGRPNSYYIKRNQDGVRIYLWPVPDTTTASSKTISIWYTRHIMDVTTYTEDADVPQRWLDAIVSLLAYRLILTHENPAPDLVALLDKESTIALTSAWQGDSDGASLSLAPNIRCYNA